MSEADGGPAFPLNPETNVSHKGEVYRDVMGMSLRDWFAGQALIGLLANPDPINARTASDASCCAYELANAMIAEKRCREGAE